MAFMRLPWQGPAMSPRDEFAEALRSIGCVVGGEHPMMDGKKHRISVEGEKLSEIRHRACAAASNGRECVST